MMEKQIISSINEEQQLELSQGKLAFLDDSVYEKLLLDGIPKMELIQPPVRNFVNGLHLYNEYENEPTGHDIIYFIKLATKRFKSDWDDCGSRKITESSNQNIKLRYKTQKRDKKIKKRIYSLKEYDRKLRLVHIIKEEQLIPKIEPVKTIDPKALDLYKPFVLPFFRSHIFHRMEHSAQYNLKLFYSNQVLSLYSLNVSQAVYRIFFVYNRDVQQYLQYVHILKFHVRIFFPPREYQ